MNTYYIGAHQLDKTTGGFTTYKPAVVGRGMDESEVVNGTITKVVNARITMPGCSFTWAEVVIFAV